MRKTPPVVPPDPQQVIFPVIPPKQEAGRPDPDYRKDMLIMNYTPLAAALLIATLPGCNTSPSSGSASYGPPEASGLVTARPYPDADGVCQVIGENDLTVEYLGDASTLVGCPVVETVAVEEVLSQGATQVNTVGEWILLMVPTG